MAALSRRFGQTMYALSAIKDELSNRIQKRGESLVELADDIERKSRLVYGSRRLTEAMIQEFATYEFVAALWDCELKVHVKLQYPKTVSEALSVAQDVASVLDSEKAGSCNRRVDIGDSTDTHVSQFGRGML